MPERSSDPGAGYGQPGGHGTAGGASEHDPARLAELAHAFSAWLGPRLGATGEVRVTSLETPPLNGSSNQTLVLEASWSAGGEARSGGFVVRMAPRGRWLYHSYDLDLQYRTLEAVSTTSVPVPPLIGYEPDAQVVGEPFYVMGKVEGQAPPDLPPFTAAGWVLEASEDTQAALHDNGLAMVARIHDVDVDAFYVEGLARGFGELLGRTEAWYRWAAPHGNPFLDRALEWLHEHRPTDLSPDVANWGDARPGNLVFDGVHPVAVLDWEMAAVAPPEVDLGWWLFLYRHHTEGIGVPRLPGFPPDDAVPIRYRQLCGREVRHLDYFVAFAGFRFSIIVLRALSGSQHGAALVDNPSTRLLAAATGLAAPATFLT